VIRAVGVAGGATDATGGGLGGRGCCRRRGGGGMCLRDVEISEIVRLAQARANTVASGQINLDWDSLQANHMLTKTDNLICWY
jgi:hypothetical protein